MSHSTTKRPNNYAPVVFEKELRVNSKAINHINVYANLTNKQNKNLSKRLKQIPLEDFAERDKISRSYFGRILSPAASYCKREKIRFSKTIGIKVAHMNISRITGQQIFDFPERGYTIERAGTQ